MLHKEAVQPLRFALRMLLQETVDKVRELRAFLPGQQLVVIGPPHERPQALPAALKAIREADLMIVAGTSLTAPFTVTFMLALAFLFFLDLF